jgi:hypothetical protein
VVSYARKPGTAKATGLVGEARGYRALRLGRTIAISSTEMAAGLGAAWATAQAWQRVQSQGPQSAKQTVMVVVAALFVVVFMPLLRCTHHATVDIGKRPLYDGGMARAQPKRMDEKRTLTPLALALGACLRSDDPMLRGTALTRIGTILREERGNASATARKLGVPWRTFMRWTEADDELRGILEAARNH